jgi:hypothetical protein
MGTWGLEGHALRQAAAAGLGFSSQNENVKKKPEKDRAVPDPGHLPQRGDGADRRCHLCASPSARAGDLALMPGHGRVAGDEERQ